MRFASGKDFASRPNTSITIFGMSGVGKTTLSNLLQDSGWYHYSVDYRIGTRYMGEHIVDNFKREAMRVPFLRDLLLSDSIHIQSNITFDHLKPLSTYLGKPGNPDKGGIAFAEYKTRQAQHRAAEIAALLDVPTFIGKARDIYRYENFVCDSGGSLCEVIDPENPLDPVLSCLAGNTVLLYIEGTPEHTRMLVERFRRQPKPMYYQPRFLETKWAEYKAINGIPRDDDVDPDGFAVWGFEQLLHHRIPLYQAIAAKFGYTVRMRDVPSVQSEEDFIALVANAIDQAR
ncbi:ATPase [Aestuariivirga sp.]|uniref:ATPase n=1 Tax=Aestuariivirga sp. TaxID=2650926 RepID=UPI0025C4D321|nr:ATPase [Aestuariivirga sp.]MCA3554635.1 ATPase [Aestuariivirga sp.]